MAELFVLFLERAYLKNFCDISQPVTNESSHHLAVFGDLGGFGEGIGMVLNTDRPSSPSLGVNLQSGMGIILNTKYQSKTNFKRKIYFGRSL